MDEKSEAEAVQKFATALAGWGKEKAEEWLKSDEGKAFRTKIGQWFEGHPGVVVAMALIAAAGAVAANVAIPELKQKFKITDSLSAELGADLGKIRDIVLNGVSVGLSYKKAGVEAGLSYKYTKNEKDPDSHSINAQVSNGNASLDGKATIQGEKFVLDTKAALNGDGYSLGLGLKNTRDANGNLTLGNINLRLGDKNHNITGDASYDFSTGALSFGTTHFQSFGNTDVRHSHRYDGDNGITNNLGVDLRLQDNFRLSLDHSMSAQGVNSLALSSSKSWGKDGEWSANLASRLNLADNELESLSASFGFRDKDEFQTFLVSYSRNYENQVPSDKFSLMLETSIRDLMVRGSNDLSMRDGRVTQNLSQLQVGHELNKDWTVFGGAKYGHQADGATGLNDHDRGAWLQAGVQFRKIPFTVNFRPEDNAVSFGLSIPFGR